MRSAWAAFLLGDVRHLSNRAWHSLSLDAGPYLARQYVGIE